MGRPKRSLIEVMRTKVWVAEAMRITGFKNENQLGNFLGGKDEADMLYKYAQGIHGVAANKLDKYDELFVKHYPNSGNCRAFYDIGPASKDGERLVPLWTALSGPMEDVWRVLVEYDPPIAAQKFLGEPFWRMCAYLTFRIFSSSDPTANVNFEDRASENFVEKAYKDGILDVDLDLIAFAIAAWRLAHFIGNSQSMMNYVLIGLFDQAIPDVLKPYGIAIDIEEYVAELDLKKIDEFKNVIDDMNYDINSYPVVEFENGKPVHAGFEQPFDFNGLLITVQRLSVSTYLTKKKALTPRFA